MPGYGGYEDAIAAASAEPFADRIQLPHAVLLGHHRQPKGVRTPLPDGQVTPRGEALIALARIGFGANQDSVYLSPAPMYHAAPLGYTMSADPGPRRDRGHDEAIRPGQSLAPIGRPPRHPRAVRADHVHPDTAAAAGRARPLRPVQPPGGHARGGAVPGRGQAEDDRLVGSGHLAILRRHRGRRHDRRRQRHLARQPGTVGRPGIGNPDLRQQRDRTARQPPPAVSTSRARRSRSPTRDNPGKTRAAPALEPSPTGPRSATSATSTRTASCSSPTARHSRSSPAASTSTRRKPRTRYSAAPSHLRRRGHRRPRPGDGGVGGGVRPARPGAVPGPELEQEIIAFVKSKIAGFKAPRTVRFVRQPAAQRGGQADEVGAQGQVRRGA